MENMGTKEAKPEVYMLFQIGLQPTDVYKLGIVSKSASYRYWIKYQKALKRIPRIIYRDIERGEGWVNVE